LWSTLTITSRGGMVWRRTEVIASTSSSQRRSV
jgi:hypothetical protein